MDVSGSLSYTKILRKEKAQLLLFCFCYNFLRVEIDGVCLYIFCCLRFLVSQKFSRHENLVVYFVHVHRPVSCYMYSFWWITILLLLANFLRVEIVLCACWACGIVYFAILLFKVFRLSKYIYFVHRPVILLRDRWKILQPKIRIYIIAFQQEEYIQRVKIVLVYIYIYNC